MAFNQNIGSGLIKFTFTDEDGDVFASFRMNPTDVRLVGRAEELQKYLEKVGNASRDLTVDDVLTINNEIETKFCDFLGYNARSELFGMMSATTILPDGGIFAMAVFEAISKAVNPEIEKRAKKMQEAVSKYTGKYMTGYDLPKSLTVGGVSYGIRTDFRAVLDILKAMNDPDLDETAKTIVMLKITYPKWRDIPQEHLQEACQKAADFIDCGHKDDGKPSPRLIDWEKDAPIIIPAVNSVAHAEIRALPELHWWTFLSYFMEIRESTLSTVLHIRQKKAKHKKMEQWEKDFLSENRELVELKAVDDAEIRKAKDNILKFL